MSDKLETLINLVQDGVDMKLAMESTIATSIASHNAGVLGVASPNVDKLDTKKPDEVDTNQPEDSTAVEKDPKSPEDDNKSESFEDDDMVFDVSTPFSDDNDSGMSLILEKRKHCMQMMSEAFDALEDIYENATCVEDLVANKDMINFSISTISEKLWKLNV